MAALLFFIATGAVEAGARLALAAEQNCLSVVFLDLRRNRASHQVDQLLPELMLRLTALLDDLHF